MRPTPLRYATIVLALTLLAPGLSCAKDGADKTPVRNAAIPTPSHANLAYGPHERNVLDLWLPEQAVAPVPLVLFIHGGGFIDGGKENLSPNVYAACRDRGVAVAAINYRFITTDPFPAPLRDSARAVQYLKSRAAEFKLDPKRFAVYGGSAGAGTSMWIAFHDDLANPASADPVERESSRVACAGSIAGQSTYDPRTLNEWLGPIVLQHRAVPLLYGGGDLDKMLHPDAALDALMKECSPIEHLTKDDPPLFMFYILTKDQGVGALIHSVVFGQKLKEKLDAFGIENELCTVESRDPGDVCEQHLTAFLFKHLGVAAPDAAGADAAR